MAFVALSIALALNGLFLAHASMGLLRLRSLTIPKTFYWTYIVFVYVPSIFVFLSESGTHRETYLAATTSVLLIVPLAVLTVRLLIGTYTFRDREYYRQPLKYFDANEKSYRYIFICLLTGSILILLTYLASVQQIALFHALLHPHTYLNLAQIREESFKLLPVSSVFKYLFSWLRVLILPFLSLFSFLAWWKGRKRFWLQSFLLSILITLFYASLSLAKMPVAWIVLILAVAYYLAMQGKLSIKKLISLGILALAFPAFVIFIVTPWEGANINHLMIVKSLFRRILWVPAWVLYHYFEVFPEHVDFLYGQSIGILSALRGEPFFPVANHVYQYMNPDGPLAYGLANAPFIGNLYADFGFSGVIIGSFFIGVLAEFSHSYLTQKPKTLLYVAIYAYLICAFYLFNHTALPVVLNSNGLIWAFVLVIGIRLINGILRTLGRETECEIRR